MAVGGWLVGIAALLQVVEDTLQIWHQFGIGHLLNGQYIDRSISCSLAE